MLRLHTKGKHERCPVNCSLQLAVHFTGTSSSEYGEHDWKRPATAGSGRTKAGRGAESWRGQKGRLYAPGVYVFSGRKDCGRLQRRGKVEGGRARVAERQLGWVMLYVLVAKKPVSIAPETDRGECLNKQVVHLPAAYQMLPTLVSTLRL